MEALDELVVSDHQEQKFFTLSLLFRRILGMLEEDIFAIAVSSTHASLERVSGMRATIPYTIVIHACSGLCILMSSLTVYIEGETIEGKTKDLIYRRNGTTIPTETT